MSENNVALRLERYDEVCTIAFNRHFSPSSISKRLANSIGNYRHTHPWRLIGDALCRALHSATDQGSRQRRGNAMS